METLPEIILDKTNIEKVFPLLDKRECDYIEEAQKLFAYGFYSQSLLSIWTAAVNSLKRKVEAYGVDLWSSVVKDESGRKKFDSTGETIVERWSNVDDLVLISGATRLGLLNPKAGKSLEMINWMRNHASPAHDSNTRVEKEDVISLVLLLQKNLFEQPLPEPGHSVATLFDPIRTKALDCDELSVLKDQINSYKPHDIRTVFGFMMDLISSGNNPAKDNAMALFPYVWEKSNDDLRKTLGVKYHTLMISPESDDSSDNGAKGRIFELLVLVKGVQYIPDGTRARVFRRAAAKLSKAKDTSYGWSAEESASKNLLQLGTCIPMVAFEEVYQEIISIWCGNYWGRSDAYLSLKPFIECLNTNQIRQIIRMFHDNLRVKSELSQSRPKNNAINLLHSFESRLTIEAHKQELKDTIMEVEKL